MLVSEIKYANKNIISAEVLCKNYRHSFRGRRYYFAKQCSSRSNDSYRKVCHWIKAIIVKNICLMEKYSRLKEYFE